MYKTYLRPILQYGIDLCTMTSREIDYIKTCECNVIKHIMNLDFRNRHTTLLLALNMIDFEDHIKICKIKTLVRLTESLITRKVIDNRLTTIDNDRAGRNDLVREVYSLVKDNLPAKFNINILINECQKEIDRIKMSHYMIRAQDDSIKEVIKTISIKNPMERITKLRQLLSSFDSNQKL